MSADSSLHAPPAAREERAAEGARPDADRAVIAFGPVLPLSPAKRRWSTAALLALTLSCLGGLVTLRVAEVDGSALVFLQIGLLVSFVALTLLDFRASVAIVLVELAVAGVSGRWTILPGNVPGRIFLYGVVTLRAVAALALEWMRTRRLKLGRYGPHALLLAIVMPAVWMTLGFARGNPPTDVVADGNGLVFLAFVTVLVVVVRQDGGRWLRKWVLIACSINAALVFALFALSAWGVVALTPTLGKTLLGSLQMGGAVGYMPNGAYRLYLGSGLYLQVGLALITFRLLQQSRLWWLWTLYSVFWVDVVITYTRGYWLGAVMAVGLVLLLGAPSLRRAASVAAGTLALLTLATGIGFALRFSVPDYLLNRAQTVVESRESGPGEDPTNVDPRKDVNFLPPGANAPDQTGAISNQIRSVQARALARYIVRSPVFGYGFGSTAAGNPAGRTYSHELAYLDILFKTGVVGLLLFLSFPLRLLWDSIRARRERLSLPPGVSPRGASVVAAVVASLLLTGATNPYFLAAFGLLPIAVGVGWLDGQAAPAGRSGSD